MPVVELGTPRSSSYESRFSRKNSEIVEPEITRERLLNEIGLNVETILENQAENGLFPAANLTRETSPREEAFDSANHYDEAWIRDNAIVSMGLYNTAIVGRHISELSKVAGEAQEGLQKNIKGMLALAANDPWDSAFEQKIKHHSYVAEDGQVVRFTKRTEDAPPVHFKINGDMCPTEWAQNQPDSWGVLLNVTGSAIKGGQIELSGEERQTLKKIGNYLININAEMFDCSSMWEELEVHRPPPISSVLMVAQGLEKTADLFDRKYKDKAVFAVDKANKFVRREFPREISGPVGHFGQYDLATMVALSLQPPDTRYGIDTYLTAANYELGNGHGKIRYVGDSYQGRVEYVNGEARVEQEAVWFMSIPLEAIERFKNSKSGLRIGRVEEAVAAREKGLTALKTALSIGGHYGYYPELWIPTEEGFKPNSNDLLWNRALMINASALALETSGR